MIKKRIYLVIVLILIFAVKSIFCSPGKNTGIFTYLPSTARSSAMNQGLTADANDVNAVFYNPAFLANNISNEINFMHKMLYADITHQSISCVYKFNNNTGVGIGINYIDYGRINVSKIDYSLLDSLSFGYEEVDSKNSANALSVNISYGISLTEKLSTGLGVKYLSETISGYTGNGYSLYLGTLYYITEKLKIGSYADIFSSNVKFNNNEENLEKKYAVGISYKLLDNLKLNIDTIKMSSQDIFVNTSFEYILKNINIRNGFTFSNDYDRNYSFGIGFNIKNISIDYAYSLQSKLNNVHTFGLSFNID